MVRIVMPDTRFLEYETDPAYITFWIPVSAGMTKLRYYLAGLITRRLRRQAEGRRYNMMKMKKWIACMICVVFLAGCASMNQTTDPSSRNYDDKKEVDMTVRP